MLDLTNGLAWNLQSFHLYTEKWWIAPDWRYLYMILFDNASKDQKASQIFSMNRSTVLPISKEFSQLNLIHFFSQKHQNQTMFSERSSTRRSREQMNGHGTESQPDSQIQTDGPTKWEIASDMGTSVHILHWPHSYVVVRTKLASKYISHLYIGSNDHWLNSLNWQRSGWKRYKSNQNGSVEVENLNADASSVSPLLPPFP